MRIGELAKESGVTVETIRFYENEGLLPRAERSLNNYRCYTEGHLKRLFFIRHCRSLDMSLDDIKLLINVDARRSEDAARVHALISEHIHKIDLQIDSLKNLRHTLTQLKKALLNQRVVVAAQVVEKTLKLLVLFHTKNSLIKH